MTFSNIVEASYLEHCADCNELWHMLQRREGTYRTDATAQSWQRIMHEHYLQARALLRCLDPKATPATIYQPGAPSYVGKAS